jgi:hypothetical protein
MNEGRMRVIAARTRRLLHRRQSRIYNVESVSFVLMQFQLDKRNEPVAGYSGHVEAWHGRDKSVLTDSTNSVKTRMAPRAGLGELEDGRSVGADIERLGHSKSSCQSLLAITEHRSSRTSIKPLLQDAS